MEKENNNTIRRLEKYFICDLIYHLVAWMDPYSKIIIIINIALRKNPTPFPNIEATELSEPIFSAIDYLFFILI